MSSNISTGCVDFLILQVDKSYVHLHKEGFLLLDKECLKKERFLHERKRFMSKEWCFLPEGECFVYEENVSCSTKGS